MLQDFKITHTVGRQISAMMKYLNFGLRIELFFAGDVVVIKRLIQHIRSVELQVTINNDLDFNAPLARAIWLYMMNNPYHLTGVRKVDYQSMYKIT